MDKIERLNEAVKWIIFEGLAKNHTDLAQKLGYKKSSFSQISQWQSEYQYKFY
ncbi:hypothetical protein [Myroides odoratus]|uniref:Uncharacterized protein n=1 Tax=Myroides odoratus TaxID=256 RepID=A0A9Q6Z425_MYROD|nr:hypothetical protein [Myroides odoratus]EHQ40982.1 hypothetical protein Myrod_0138 [Myroides odoratus DSM 2801]EKB08386.1 hypothetical protein HMPREF9716_01205 [Myroides odoratus CIP 103059]QQU01928.1 hypothetical protein I6I88_09360 [Myroides odoratus]WQD55781.1 hypothetical protein U0010_09615 [Myroides odoratus]STZ32016.1 Uncharacterised protein [Myroides odoratus]